MEVKVHLATGETFETAIPINVKKGLTMADVIRSLEETTMSVFKGYVDGIEIDRKAKL